MWASSSWRSFERASNSAGVLRGEAGDSRFQFLAVVRTSFPFGGVLRGETGNASL